MASISGRKKRCRFRGEPMNAKERRHPIILVAGGMPGRMSKAKSGVRSVTYWTYVLLTNRLFKGKLLDSPEEPAIAL